MHADEWVFGGFVTIGWGVFKGSKVVWRGVGVAHRDVEHADPQALEFPGPAEGFVEIGLIGVLGIRTPVVLQGQGAVVGCALALLLIVERYAIVDIEPAGDHQVRQIVPDALDDIANKSGAILEATAVGAGAGACGEEFVEQIAMALLDVDKLETELIRELGGPNVVIDQSLQVIIIDQRERRIEAEARIVHRDERLAVAVSAGVRQL